MNVIVGRLRSEAISCSLEATLSRLITERFQTELDPAACRDRGIVDCPMAYAVSHLSVTAEFRVRFQVSPCGICGGKSGIETGFYPCIEVCPVRILRPTVDSRLLIADVI